MPDNSDDEAVVEESYNNPAIDAPEVDESLDEKLADALRDSDAVRCVWRLSTHAVAQRDGLAMVVLNAHLLVPLDECSPRRDREAMAAEVCHMAVASSVSAGGLRRGRRRGHR